MRILVFGSSGEMVGTDGPDGSTVDQICAGVRRHTGDPVEGHTAFAYPNEALARHVANTFDRVEPDIVVLHCRSAPVRDLSLDLGLRRRFGGSVPKPIDTARDLARRVTHYNTTSGVDRQHGHGASIYGAVRDALLLAGLGATPSSVAETVAVYDDVIRLLVARECLLVVVGPASTYAVLKSARLQRQKLQRLQALEWGLEAICRARRVPYCQVLTTVAANPERYLGPDRSHRSGAGATLRAEATLKVLLPLLPTAGGSEPAPHGVLRSGSRPR